MSHFVFVYGTLKTGESNHHFLAGRKAMFAEVDGIVLHACPGYPFAGYGSGTARGEVYEVDDATLELLDRLEEHPHWYKRELVTARLLGHNGSSREKRVWIYLHPEAEKYPKVPGNLWTGHDRSSSGIT